MPPFVKRAACCAALSLTSFTSPAADVSLVAAAKTVTIDCDRMVIPDKSFLSVDVRRDERKGLYVYRYTVRSAEPAAPRVQGVLFKDLADNGGSANKVHAASGDITLESPAAPGVVRYSLIGELQPGLSDADLSRLTEQFGGDREGMLASVADSLSDGCPYGQDGDVFDRGMTGTIIGPSAVKLIETAVNGPADKSIDREVEMRVEDLDQSSIVVTDSRLAPVQVGPSALERRADGTPVVRFALDATSGTCNARGVLVRAKMRDGTPVAASVDVEPPPCPVRIDQALLVLPSG
jgi:hypothetical protein